MFRDSSHESVAVEDRCVVVDVTWYDAHLGVASQRRAISVEFVVCENVEVPDGSAARWVTVNHVQLATSSSVV